MNILLVGSGGREHALAWKISRSPLLKTLVAAPGNPGLEGLADCRPVRADDIDGLVALAKEISADLVVAGPEAPLVEGLADRLNAEDIPCFGPSRAAARLEASKAFTKAFAGRHGIPTARSETFTDAASARAALDRFAPPFVLKASGLAAGKGVIIAEDRAEAEAALDELFGGKFGAAGDEVVIEDFLRGTEASLFAVCDGERAVLFGSAQDHKRAFDGDRGPNTGGMGTVSPAPALTTEAQAEAFERIIRPTVAGMAKEDAPFRGVLFAGLMLTADGPQLIEFNVRWGDPECQSLMLRLESDVVPYLQAAATGGLENLPQPEWRGETAVCVVLAADGYPEAPVAGGEVTGAEAPLDEGAAIFHAGTKRREDGALVASGGRVLNVCGRGPTVEAARAQAYAALERVTLPGGRFRRDIGLVST